MRTDELGASTGRLVRGTFATLGVTSLAAVLAAGSLVGPTGVRGALVGTGLVALLFGGSAVLLALVVRRNPTLAAGVLAIGAFVRLGAYAFVLTVVSGSAWIDSTSLAAAAGVAVVVTLAYELHALSRMPRLFWVDDFGPRQSVQPATRS